MTTNDPEKPLRHAKDVVHRVLDGRAVLVNLASGACFELDPIGTRIWELIGEGLAPGRIVDVLLEEYETDRAAIEAELSRLLDELSTQGLVQPMERTS